MDLLLLEKNATSNSYQITPISHAHLILKHQQQRYVSIIVTGSRKRGPFLQKSDCVLDPSAASVKCILHARENSLILILVCCVPKVTVLRVLYSCLPRFRDIHVYFNPVAKCLESPYIHVHNVWRLLLRNRAATNGYGGSPSCLCRCVAALIAGRLLSHLHRREARQWRLSGVLLAPIATNVLLQEGPLFLEWVTIIVMLCTNVQLCTIDLAA